MSAAHVWHAKAPIFSKVWCALALLPNRFRGIEQRDSRIASSAAYDGDKPSTLHGLEAAPLRLAVHTKTLEKAIA